MKGFTLKVVTLLNRACDEYLHGFSITRVVTFATLFSQQIGNGFVVIEFWSKRQSNNKCRYTSNSVANN